MAISRPLLIVLVVALVGLVATTAVRVLGSGGEDASPAAQTATTGANAGGPSGSATDSAATKSPPARDEAAQRAKQPVKPADPQAPVLRAIAARKVVVLFFGQYRSADDQATRRAVREVGRESKGVAVFTASINDVSDYPRVIQGLEIAQSPSTVVIDRSGSAQVVQGFLDTGSLRQLVADARS